jgi:uncharacterized Zn finger protein (UPF0148 family)
MTLFERWEDACQQACNRPPERIGEVVCPSCGARELQLRFVDHRADGKAFVDFWCANCLYGIALGASEVPAGYQPVRRVDAHIPKYKDVPTTMFEQWLEACKQAYNLPPERIGEVVCPNCGARELQMRFVNSRPNGEASVAFWCDHCLEGISSRVYAVPAAYQRTRNDDAYIPNYRLAPLTLFEQWRVAWQQACDLPPERIAEVACPSCGARDLQVRFVQHHPEWRAFGVFWCANCLKGISLGPCSVPAAHERVRPEDAHIPNFDLVPRD